MKNILFITPSILSANLLTAVMPLLKSEATFHTLHSLEELDKTPAGDLKKAHLVIVDKRVFMPQIGFEEQKNTLMSHPKLGKANFILVYEGGKDKREIIDSKDFTAVHAKPFLPEVLAKIIEKGLKA